MTNKEREILEGAILAPYIQKATTLIRKKRAGGGNMYRHCFYVMGVLIDYHYVDPIMLKAAILHDIIEDCPEFDPNEIINLDNDGPKVYEIVCQLSKSDNQTKVQYLESLVNISNEAKIVKCADRISNLVDINIYTYGLERTKRTLHQTIKYIFPIAKEVDTNMYTEIFDLVKQKTELVRFYESKICPHINKVCNV